MQTIAHGGMMARNRRQDDHHDEDDPETKKLRKIVSEAVNAAIPSFTKNGEGWLAYLRKTFINPPMMGMLILGLLQVWNRAQQVEVDVQKALQLSIKTNEAFNTLTLDVISLRQSIDAHTMVLDARTSEIREMQQDVKLMVKRDDFNREMSSLRALNRDILPKLQNIDEKMRRLSQ